MNQQSEEKIRQLFHELREEDDQRVPHFSSTLEAALSKTESRKPAHFIWKAVLATASILLIVGLTFLILKQSSVQQNVSPRPTDDLALRSPDRKIEPPPVSPVIPALPITKFVGPRKIIRKKSRPARHELSSMLISRWQSPTDFLLSTPGAELFRSVPKITDSAVNFKSISTGEKN